MARSIVLFLAAIVSTASAFAPAAQIRVSSVCSCSGAHADLLQEA
jgi:hypothetical protein